jgi:hypothetical protein
MDDFVTESKELVETDSELVSTVNDADYEGYLTEIETAAKYRDRVLQVVAALTLPSDWVDMDGKPYLQGTGAERLRQKFGLTLSSPTVKREIREDSHGPYYRYRYECVVSGPHAAPMTAVGLCSARDKFFAWRNNAWLPVDEVNENHIEMKAMNNMLVNAVTRALGLRGLSWEILQKAGIKKREVSSVEYKGKTEEKGSDGRGEMTAEKAEARQMILDICAAYEAQGQKKDPFEMCVQYGTWKNKEGKTILGKRTVQEMSNRAVSVMLDRIRKDYDLLCHPEGDSPAEGETPV